MQSQILSNLLKQRVFGKQITNLIQSKPIKNQNRISFCHPTKFYDDQSKKNQTHHSKVYQIESKNKTLVIKSIQIHQNPIVYDIQHVPQYFQQNIKFMISQSNQTQSTFNYLIFQSDITQNMRIILLDWLIDLNLKFKSHPQTFFLTCHIIDKYLSKKQVNRTQLQLIGTVSFYIAAKYQQTYKVPKIQQLIHVCSKSFTKTQFLQMQACILQTLQFKLIHDSSYKFYEPFAKILRLEGKSFSLGRYILQASLYDIKMMEYKPYKIAASTVYIVNKLRRERICWSEQLVKMTGLQQNDLKQCGGKLYQNLLGINNVNQAKGLRRKFGQASLNEISKSRFEKMNF